MLVLFILPLQSQTTVWQFDLDPAGTFLWGAKAICQVIDVGKGLQDYSTPPNSCEKMLLSVNNKEHAINSQDIGLLKHKPHIFPYFMDRRYSKYFQGRTGTAGFISIYSRLKAEYRPKYISIIS